MSVSLRSIVLVTVQFACLLFIALSGPLLARNPLWLLAELAGIALGVWAILAMRIGNLNITPEVRPAAQFVRRGPYRYIRHPMYSALLLASLALVMDSYSALRLAIWLLLLLDIAMKLTYEEHMLERAFAEYSSYRHETKRLIPYIF